MVYAYLHLARTLCTLRVSLGLQVTSAFYWFLVDAREKAAITQAIEEIQKKQKDLEQQQREASVQENQLQKQNIQLIEIKVI